MTLDDKCGWKEITDKQESVCQNCNGAHDKQITCRMFASKKAIQGEPCAWYVIYQHDHHKIPDNFCEGCDGVKPNCFYYLGVTSWSPHDDAAFPQMTKHVLDVAKQFENELLYE